MCPRAHRGFPGGQGYPGFGVCFLEQYIKVLEAEWRFLWEIEPHIEAHSRDLSYELGRCQSEGAQLAVDYRPGRS